MNLFHDFTKPEYTTALGTSIQYGLLVVLGMLVIGAALTLAGGGLAAKWNKKDPAHHH
ncbi:hypothetical protein IV102_37125 [bacterium]|nr:hypothetical protein [bacterium]